MVARTQYLNTSTAKPVFQVGGPSLIFQEPFIFGEESLGSLWCFMKNMYRSVCSRPSKSTCKLRGKQHVAKINSFRSSTFLSPASIYVVEYHGHVCVSSCSQWNAVKDEMHNLPACSDGKQSFWILPLLNHGQCIFSSQGNDWRLELYPRPTPSCPWDSLCLSLPFCLHFSSPTHLHIHSRKGSTETCISKHLFFSRVCWRGMQSLHSLGVWKGIWFISLSSPTNSPSILIYWMPLKHLALSRYQRGTEKERQSIP